MLSGLVAPDVLTRRLSFQTLLFSLGAGIYTAGGVIFLSFHSGLSAAEISAGFVAGAAVDVLFGRGIGRLADRWGPQKVWSAAALVEGVIYILFPLIHDVYAYVLAMVLTSAIGAFAGVARTAYTFALAEERSQARSTMQAYMRTAFSIGSAAGMLASSALVITESPALIASIPVVCGALLLFNGVFVLGLPHVTSRDSAEQATQPELGQQTSFGRRGYILSLGNGVLATHVIALELLIPLWIVHLHGLLWLIGPLMVLGSLQAILTQVPLTKLVDSRLGLRRGVAFAVLAAGVAFGLLACTGWVPRAAAIPLLVLAVAGMTVVEAVQSAVAWLLVEQMALPHQRSEFQGLLNQGTAAADAATPFAFVALIHALGPAGFLALGLAYVAAGLSTETVLRPGLPPPPTPPTAKPASDHAPGT